MKYAHWIGTVACLLLIAGVFMPWVYIPSVSLTVSGWHAEGTQFGKPGLVPLVFSGLMMVLFHIPRVWSRLIILILATLQLAWMIRNYILLTSSFIGEVPEKSVYLISMVPLSILILLMGIFAKTPIKQNSPIN
ncbi:MAG: hypothetical protein EBX50_11490 [Chitinophagia bacterium]|nr:hypothetical protein [Chitinophagia bacterium]